MALISAITLPEGEYWDEGHRLIEALDRWDESRNNNPRPVFNGIKLEDSDGRVWFGYNYGGGSWWITKSMAAEGDTSANPYEFAEQKDPLGTYPATA